MTCIGDTHLSIGTDLDAKACNKPAGLAAEKFAVQSAQKLRRIRCFSRNRVEGPDRKRASHCGSEPLAADVSNHDYRGSVCLRKNLEKITAHLPGWKISCLNRVAWQKWKHSRNEVLLDFARGGQFRCSARLFAGHTGEPRKHHSRYRKQKHY